MSHRPFLLLRWGIALLTLCAAGASRPAEPAAPACYVRRATWAETLIASREALARQERATGKGLPLPDLGQSDFTLLAWIHAKSDGVILSRSALNGPWACNGKAWFLSHGHPSYDVGCVGVSTARTPVADGQWHHLALAYSDTARSVEFYLDGKPDGAVSLKGNPDLPNDIVRVAAIAPNFHGGGGFVGDLDELRLYNRRLSPEEVAEQGAGAPLAGCVGSWPFDGDAVDASGNSHHGAATRVAFTEGMRGRALHCDGKTVIAVPNTDAARRREELWRPLERDFPAASSEMAAERRDHIWDQDWQPGDLALLARRYAAACAEVRLARSQAERLAPGVKDLAGLERVRVLYHQAYAAREAVAGLKALDLAALRRAVADLTQTFGRRYPKGRDYLARLDAVEKELPGLIERAATGEAPAVARAQEIVALRREALLANPLLNFDRLLVIRRRTTQMGLSANWESNSSLPQTGYDNEIDVFSPVSPEGKLTPLFRPEGGRFVGDIDLHWNADRMLFSMPGDNGRWQLFEMKVDGGGVRQLPLIHEPDVDNYDACYLPNGDVLFSSTAQFTGVPCVTGSAHVSNLYVLKPDGRIRRLTFEQDHDWCPTVMPDGRVLYLRWEYSDIPHFVARILFRMNPDGTEQMEWYGSNSYWPNSMFYARPAPNNPTKFVAVVSGHHDTQRMGELVLFDAAKGRHEADGALQRIPGWGKKVEPVIRDGLVGGSWPKFLHPWPLSDKYFLVACKPSPQAEWGLYLVDVFDNMLLLKEDPGYALLQPIPLVRRLVPPVIPEKVKPERKDALVYLSDIYAGPGLKGVPRGTVKKLRLFTYQFAYYGMGGQVNRVGLDGPWDVKRIMGTVPVQPDGSAYFRVPANTPISVQPLDSEGKALQLMRSWMTAMPGEVLSCVGCHERQSSTTANLRTTAFRGQPAEISPWYGPTRGFSFRREVQPVLDRYCISCHNGSVGGQAIPDFRDLPDVHPQARDAGYNNGTHFPPSYLALRSYVRGHTIESDIHVLEPCEFHADTTRLVQLLKKGHHGVSLDAEAWDRLNTWIDLNTPAHGTWSEIVGPEKVQPWRDRRREMLKRYAGIDEDPEALTPPAPSPVQRAKGSQAGRVALTPPAPSPVRRARGSLVPAGAGTSDPVVSDALLPSDGRGVAEGRGEGSLSLDLGDGVKLELARVPAGAFLMGDAAGCADEQPVTPVKIARPFWIGRFEVTNEQFARFDPTHNSRLESGDFLQFSEQERGYPTNGPRQPVCRVSWSDAMAFCEWLSRRTGRRFTLPTEAEWEYACRAGTTTPMSYGPVGADFSKQANLADSCLRAVDTFGWSLPSGAVPPWRPAIENVKDGFRVSAPVGSFAPNAWGLFDMHGNVAEWTRSLYQRAESAETADRMGGNPASLRVVRGGSWYDRPFYARASYREAYPAWREVYDVGFRVVCEDEPSLARRN